MAASAGTNSWTGTAFRSMDRDKDGLVTWEEYWRVMSRMQK